MRVTLTEKKTLVVAFLARCNDYANGKLAEYAGRLEAASGAERAELERKIDQWTTYRQFNEYTIDELATTRLDAWFPGGDE